MKNISLSSAEFTHSISVNVLAFKRIDAHLRQTTRSKLFLLPYEKVFILTGKRFFFPLGVQECKQEVTVVSLVKMVENLLRVSSF